MHSSLIICTVANSGREMASFGLTDESRAGLFVESCKEVSVFLGIADSETAD